MIDPVIILAFVPAALALNLTPGADMMFCLGQGLRGGPRAALAADAGIALGVMVHVALAGAGLGAAIAAAPWLFEVIRWAGVGYLLILAVQTLRAGPVAPDLPPVRPSRAFREALVVNLMNPKVILFVLAFIPQFIDRAEPVFPQFLLLGGIIALGGLLINGAVGLFAGGVGRTLAQSPVVGLWLGRISAGVFIALAARLAFVQRS